MEKNINLAKILNSKPVNTKLWSPLFGDVYTSNIYSEDTIIVVNHHAESSSFYNNGKYFNHAEAEPLLFPSKEMRDWSKFAWKKGDILVTEDGSTKVIFECFEDDTYLTFKGKYCLQKTNIDETFIVDTNGNLTECFSLQAKNIAQIYLYNIEDRIGGRLNMETLEIEKFKPKKQPAFKPFDKVLCRDDIGKEWNIDLFESTVTHNSKYNYKCMANIWKYCIPYEGNEHLLGTTKDVEG